MTDSEPRYRVEKFHMTAMQKRLYPEAGDKPFVVRDDATGTLVGLPDRYTNRSGAQVRADHLNTVRDTCACGRGLRGGKHIIGGDYECPEKKEN